MHSCCKGKDGGGGAQIADDEMNKAVEQRRYEGAACQRGPRQGSEGRGRMAKACVCVYVRVVVVDVVMFAVNRPMGSGQDWAGMGRTGARALHGGYRQHGYPCRVDGHVQRHWLRPAKTTKRNKTKNSTWHGMAWHGIDNSGGRKEDMRSAGCTWQCRSLRGEAHRPLARTPISQRRTRAGDAPRQTSLGRSLAIRLRATLDSDAKPPTFGTWTVVCSHSPTPRIRLLQAIAQRRPSTCCQSPLLCALLR